MRKILFLMLLALIPSLALAGNCTDSNSKVCRPSADEIAVDSGGAITVNNGGVLDLIGDNGAKLRYWDKSNSFTAMSGATVTATDFFPAGTLVLGCAAYVNTLITGASDFEVGNEDDPDEFHTGVALAADTVASIGASLTQNFYYAAAKDLVLTAGTSDFTAGAVTVTCIGWTITDPTS